MTQEKYTRSVVPTDGICEYERTGESGLYSVSLVISHRWIYIKCRLYFSNNVLNYRTGVHLKEGLTYFGKVRRQRLGRDLRKLSRREGRDDV